MPSGIRKACFLISFNVYKVCDGNHAITRICKLIKWLNVPGVLQ